MKFIFEGNAKSKASCIGLLTEEAILNPDVANQKLSLHNLKIDRVEIVDGEKVVYIKEAVENLLNG